MPELALKPSFDSQAWPASDGTTQLVIGQVPVVGEVDGAVVHLGNLSTIR